MKIFRRCQRPVGAALVAGLVAVWVPVVPAYAAMVGTDQVIRQEQGSPRDRVASFLGRADVERQLRALGIDPAEAKARTQALSDQEISAIAGRIDSLPAGQGAVGAIVGAAVLIFVVLLITDLLGLTHVFGFTKKGALNPN